MIKRETFALTICRIGNFRRVSIHINDPLGISPNLPLIKGPDTNGHLNIFNFVTRHIGRLEAFKDD